MFSAKSCVSWQHLTITRCAVECCLRLHLVASAPCLCQGLLSLFKTDINAAFRRVPIKELDRKYGHVVFVYEARVRPFAQLCAIVSAVLFARE